MVKSVKTPVTPPVEVEIGKLRKLAERQQSLQKKDHA